MDAIKINNKEVKLTKHAIHRIKRRNIPIEAIQEAYTNYKNIRRCRRVNKADSLRLLGRNGIVLILNLEKDVIITIMRDSKQYSKSKYKHSKNKRQLENKRLYGNRAKK